MSIGPLPPVDPSAIEGLLHQERPRGARPFLIGAVRTTGSTNVDLRAEPAADSYRVLTAEEQTAGRGRSGRTWVCPPSQGLMFSVRFAPAVPAREWGWTGAVLGLAIRAALAGLIAVDLKWPNDLEIGGDKLGGILAEAVDGEIVVGAGINVSVDRADLPRVDAVSLASVGVHIGREELLARILGEFDDRVRRWEHDGLVESGLLASYRRACVSLGRQVAVQLPGGSTVSGTALDVAEDGSIVVLDGTGQERTFSAGDVRHLR